MHSTSYLSVYDLHGYTRDAHEIYVIAQSYFSFSYIILVDNIQYANDLLLAN